MSARTSALLALLAMTGCRVVTVCTPVQGSAASYDSFMNQCAADADNSVQWCKARAEQLGHAQCQHLRVYKVAR